MVRSVFNRAKKRSGLISDYKRKMERIRVRGIFFLSDSGVQVIAVNGIAGVLFPSRVIVRLAGPEPVPVEEEPFGPFEIRPDIFLFPSGGVRLLSGTWFPGKENHRSRASGTADNGYQRVLSHNGHVGVFGKVAPGFSRPFNRIEDKPLGGIAQRIFQLFEIFLQDVIFVQGQESLQKTVLDILAVSLAGKFLEGGSYHVGAHEMTGLVIEDLVCQVHVPAMMAGHCVYHIAHAVMVWRICLYTAEAETVPAAVLAVEVF